MTLSRTLAALSLTATAIVTAAAADAPLVPPPPPPPAAAPAPAPGQPPAAPAPPAGPWTYKGRLGAFFTNVVTGNADTSRDPTIASTQESLSYVFSFDGFLGWKDGANSVDQSVLMKYGRTKTENQAWVKSNDEARYDGVYRREIAKPNFVYLSWGAETVFQGPDPDNRAFDPITGKAGAGFGQLYENMLPEKDRFEWRLGAGVRKSWGPSLSDADERWRTGAEAYLRYERMVRKDFSFYGQYEGFAEFRDLAHVTNLLTGGLVFKMTGYLSAEFNIRAYYESRPKDVPSGVPGYSEWSVRQDTLIGLVYSFP